MTDKNNLVNLICVISGVTGTNLETLRTQLLKKDEAELRLLLAGNYTDMMKGLAVEHFSPEHPEVNEQERIMSLNFSEEQAQQAAIDEIQANVDDAYNIYNSQHLGAITGAYDRSKSEDDKLSSKNVWKVIQYQMGGVTALINARDHKLTRREYFEQNSQRIKDMILTRLEVLQTTTGSTMLDSLRGKYSKEQTKQIISDYVDEVLSTATMEEMKNLQKQLVTQSGSVEVLNLTNLTKSAIKLHKDKQNKPEKPKDMMLTEIEMSKIPIAWDTEEPVSFEEVYKYERGCEYSKFAMEHLIQSKAEMQTVVSAYNKYAQFEDFSKKLLDSDEPAAERASDLLSGYADYYMLSQDGGKSELKKLIEKSKLPITLDENGLNLDAYATEGEKQKALDKLIKLGTQEQKTRLNQILGDKTIEDYQRDYEHYSKMAVGEDDAKLLSEAMKADNMGVIQRYTGPAAMVGMGLTVVGGILCFTPLAPLGAGMITVGNTVAISSMVAESGLGYADAFTKDEVSQEEWDDLNKNLIMNAAGFIIGYGAGKTGMKAFGKLIDKKLADVFKTSINEGNRIAALKNVISNPEMLKNFMTAAGAKISTDFLISYVGDLMMMGILDTNDDWKSLLKANLIGIVVGTSGDIKDVAGAGIKPKQHNIPGGSTSGKEAGGTAAQQAPGKPDMQTDENPGTAGTASKENTVKENNESTSQTQSETISRENTGKQIPAGTVSKAEVSIEQPQTVIKKDNPYGLTQNPLKDIKPKTKEEFAQYLDSLRDIDYKELPRYSAEEKAKLIELFENNNPQYVQYLVDLKECFIKYKYENRFSVDQIEKILQAIKKDEQFTLGLINSVDSKGAPLYSGYAVQKLLASYEKNPDVTKFLVQKQLKSETIEKLASLYQPDSPRYKQLVESGIFDHIKEGKISENVFSDLRENLHLSEDFLNDIKKSRSNQPLVTEIPQGTDLKDIGNFVENGEVGTLNGKLYANQCGNAVELKISREKFEELFPLIKRFNTEQGELGDCWLIAAINNVMSNPSQRADLYKLFTQEGNDILIKFPQSDHVLRFVGGKPYEATEGIEGAGGIKMIEQAFIFERNRGIFSKKQAYTKDQTETDVIARLQENPNLIKYLDGGKQGEFFDALKNSSITFKQFLLHEFPKIFKPKQYHKHLCEWVDNNKSKTVIYSCERGGHTENGREGAALLEYDLYAPHAYTVKDYNPETKTVILQNPHHTNVEIEVPLSVLSSYGSLEFT